MTTTRLRRPLLTWMLAALLALAGALLAVGPAPTSATQGPDPISADPLTDRHTFTDDVAVQVRDRPVGRSTDVVNLRDASHLAVVEITVQPGAQFPWHTHPGPVLVAVVDGDPDGAFIYTYADDCIDRPYAIGEAFVDPGDSLHTARNPSGDHETVVIAAFLGAPEAGPLTAPSDADVAAQLNASCGTDAPVPGGG